MTSIQRCPPARPGRKSSAVLFALAAGLVLAAPSPASAATVTEIQKKMGSRFEITAVHGSEAQARRAVEDAWEEIDRIEALISSWRETSETSAINRAAGEGPVSVSPELFGLLRRATKISQLTRGAFDITFAGAGRLWDFKSATPQLPQPAELASALEVVGWHRVGFDEAAHSVELPRPGMRIGLGGIGKGYAANRAVAVLKRHRATGGVVSAGGDLMAFGDKEDGSPWTVAIADPFDRDEVFASLALTDRAVVTSGDYESFVEIDGKRYAHILDPRTGWPVHELRSVTILSPDAELADALATGVFVLGPEEGLALVNRVRGVEALLVDGDGKIHTSDNLSSHIHGAEN